MDATIELWQAFLQAHAAVVGSVDADLRVGSVEETITVTGEAPIVDTSTLTKQQVLNSELVDALPSARNYVTLARMVAGTNASGNGANDVGGSQIQDVGGSLTVHGSRTTDQRVTANGINTMLIPRSSATSLRPARNSMAYGSENAYERRSVSSTLPSSSTPSSSASSALPTVN